MATKPAIIFHRVVPTRSTLERSGRIVASIGVMTNLSAMETSWNEVFLLLICGVVAESAMPTAASTVATTP